MPATTREETNPGWNRLAWSRRAAGQLDSSLTARQLSDMETTAREFTRNFRKLRAVAARGRTVRVTAPEGVYVFSREKAHKTCGSVVAALAPLRGRGFLSEGGLRGLEAGKRRPVPAKSPWDEA